MFAAWNVQILISLFQLVSSPVSVFSLMEFDPIERARRGTAVSCDDFVRFKDVIQRLRKVDDTLPFQLNRTRNRYVDHGKVSCDDAWKDYQLVRDFRLKQLRECVEATNRQLADPGSKKPQLLLQSSWLKSEVRIFAFVCFFFFFFKKSFFQADAGRYFVDSGEKAV